LRGFPNSTYIPRNKGEDELRIEKLTFSAGEAPGSPPLELAPSAITIFIGPNNGGKSTALREIQLGMLHHARPSSKVVVDAQLAPMDDAELQSKIDHVIVGHDPSNIGFLHLGRRGSTSSIHLSTIANMRAQPWIEPHSTMIRQMILPHYVMNLNGEARLTLTSPGTAQKLSERAMSTVAAIFKDDALRAKVSNVIHDAFGLYLVVDATQLGSLNYALSTEQPNSELERSFTDPAIDFFARAEPLMLASDGTKAFVGVITEVLAGEADVIFIDEPEAFLHPGLAYALGRELALNVTEDKQLFAATHSPQFLMGCLSAGAEINVIRLSRQQDQVTSNLLDSDTLSVMMSDPLLRSSNIISGLFYNAAVVVEGDSDRSFYEEINHRLAHVGKGIKHPLFINAHSKQTAPEIARALRSAGVPAAMVLDIDWLKEDGAVLKRYFDGIGLPKSSFQSASLARSQTRRDLEASGKDYKRAGGVSLLNPNERASADDFLDQMDRYGLFTVRHGEVECWLSDLPLSRAKHGWLERIFSVMGSDRTDPSYIHATNGDVWDFIQQVGHWIADPNRKGLR
jgi:predicted ATPase